MKKWLSEPNPVWAREMRQAARLARTPLILAAVTTLSGLSICAAGGAGSSTAPAAEVGAALFQTFFSLSFAIVAWVGPGVAALTIVSERTGRTWESVVLTGLAPSSIASGKFLASLTYIGLYLVALAPVGALPFLFGGVTATEVVMAFALLCVFAAIAVGFGLSVSSGASSPAMALLVTLPLSAAASMLTYFGLGMGLSFAAHAAWPVVSQGAPVWLPSAYARADFGRDYFVYLVALPAVVAAMLLGFFRAVTVANLSDPSDDRGVMLKRWFLAASIALSAMALLLMWAARAERWVMAVLGLAASFLLSLSTLLVLSSEPPGPSRRVLAQWSRSKPGIVRRFLGPGLAKTALLLFLVTTVTQLTVGGAAIWTVLRTSRSPEDTVAVAVVAGYAIGFFGFLAGLATFVRTLSRRRLSARALLAIALFAGTLGPLFLAAVAGITSSGDRAFALAAPSPFYVIAIIGRSGGSSVEHEALRAAVVSMTGWAILGLSLGAVGATRLGRQSRAAERDARALDERLRREDEVASRGASTPAAPDAP